MSTTSVNISLSHSLKEQVSAQVKAHHYSNTSDYVRQLIRQDIEKKQAQEELRALIQESLDSGISEKSPELIFAELRDYINAKL
ncbi:MAG TPA: type II toxin-antitoxin system ParD family antitoxin [Gammaproteobacteria bacterium]|nr:type II toxin-antitoxin system ParD family antitoxin [Gammaproteobacteria bacterium]